MSGGDEEVVVERDEQLEEFVRNLGKLSGQGFGDVARTFSVMDMDKVTSITAILDGVHMPRVAWWVAGIFLSWAESAPATVRRGAAEILRRLASEVESVGN